MMWITTTLKVEADKILVFFIRHLQGTHVNISTVSCDAFSPFNCRCWPIIHVLFDELTSILPPRCAIDVISSNIW